MPHVSTIGALLDPNFPPYEGQLRDLREAACALDLQVQELRASMQRFCRRGDRVRRREFITLIGGAEGSLPALSSPWACVSPSPRGPASSVPAHFPSLNPPTLFL